jgi:hypothetical protein
MTCASVVIERQENELSALRSRVEALEGVGERLRGLLKRAVCLLDESCEEGRDLGVEICAALRGEEG